MSDDPQKSDDQNQQDPLAVLEDILKDAKGKTTAQASAADVVVDDTNNSITPQLIEEEKAALEEQKSQEAAASEVERQKQIEQYRQQMKGEIQQTDAYKARQTQDEEDKSNQVDSDDGLEIKQLEHQKI